MISFDKAQELISLVKILGKKTESIKKREINHSLKSDGSPLTEADTLVNTALMRYFMSTKVLNVISEENKNVDFSLRKSWSYYWIIDPIDGTKQFISKGDDYTINIALCHGNYPVFSIVSAPARSELYHAFIGKGAFKNGEKIAIKQRKKNLLKLVASKSHMNTETETYLKRISKKQPTEIIRFGSSLKICKIAEGKADVYPRFGPTMEWDTCASQLIIEEAGGHLLTKDKQRLSYNKESFINPYFIATNDLKII